jgi:4-hydroxy-4-methyl-2-oxoglutarate aldolase
MSATPNDDFNLIASARALSTATVFEAAGKSGALPSSVKPLKRSMRLCGRALPILSSPGDNLILHHGILRAAPGDVLVVDVAGAHEHGYWGEVMTVAAQLRSIAGLVIMGGVRDSLRIIELDFPTFAITTCVRGTNKDPKEWGTLGDPLRIGDVVVHEGDIVLGDNDGVVIIPKDDAQRIVEDSIARDAAEQLILERLNAGETTLNIYSLPDLGVVA